MSHCNGLLADLQRQLQQRYDVSVPYRVEDFVSHDVSLMASLTGSDTLKRESLLVREDGDDLDITLFLDENMLQQVSDRTWSTDWQGEDFNAYCTILEGISHFLYLIWSASHNLSVKPVELELQAEVDKFVFAALNTTPHTTPLTRRSQKRLLRRLFVDISLDENLPLELVDRYRQANAGALCYCLWLVGNFELRADNHSLGAELKRFYRSHGQRKFNRIRRHTQISPCEYIPLQ